MDNKGTPKAILQADCCLGIVRKSIPFVNVEMFKDCVDTRITECKLVFSSAIDGVFYYKGLYYDDAGKEVKVTCTSFENYTSAQNFRDIETVGNLIYSEQVRVWVDGDLILDIS